MTTRALMVVVGFAALALSAGGEVWTNKNGVAFSARLVSLDDRRAVFVFDEDGATNALKLAELSPASRTRARADFDLPEIPPRLAAVYALALNDLKELKAKTDAGQLSLAQSQARRHQILEAFRQLAQRKGVTDAPTLHALTRRLNRETSK